ncbi:hypothetical protein PVAG01_09192 [Phlyctema vagabunda]|uniref:DUF2241 domain-containing protein n=1 Tax=Phlyctema vagabunda TaxID=108571 RepID=A0ABR4P7A3_9HELO
MASSPSTKPYPGESNLAILLQTLTTSLDPSTFVFISRTPNEGLPTELATQMTF